LKNKNKLEILET